MPDITAVPASSKHVTILIPESAEGDFQRIVEIQKLVLSRMGCPNCFSGRDFLFKHIREDIFVATEKGEIVHVATGR